MRNIFGTRRIVTNAKDTASIPTTTLSQQYTLPGMLARSSYDNGFAPISAISDEILKRNIRLGDTNNPETDVTGQYAFWNAMLKPNDRMGFLQFIDLLVAGFLSLPELSLLVWHSTSQGEAQPGMPDKGYDLNNIAGFTIVSNDLKTFNSKGEEEWYIDLGYGSQKKFCRDSIITLKYSLLPDDGFSGVSPGSASAQEAAIRDRLNQQQRALFDNGATPSIIVTIHARSHDEYSTIQQAYEKNNRGASKSGGVVYQSVIDNSMLAGMGEPKIVITPVGTSNNQLAIKEIVEFTESTITSNYGVSPIIYGDATTTTFQNQNLADAKFLDRVQAVLVRLFGSFENEISRLIEMPLPFTFVWDDVDLIIAEEQQLKAQTKTENVKAFLALTASGVSSAQAAQVLELEDTWQSIVLTPPASPAPLLNVFDQGCTCEKHNGLEKISEKEPSAQKKILNILKKIAQELFDDLKTNAISQSQLDRELINELIAVMQQGSSAGVDAINIDRSLADFALLSDQAVLRLEKRASKIITNYVEFVSSKIESLPADDPARKVFKDFYAKHGESRANLIAQQETKNAYQNGELDSASNINRWLKKNQPQSYIVKTWRTTSDKPCPFCKAMDGTEAGIKDSFVPGGLIEADNGDTVYLDAGYSDGTIPDAHANCQCVFKFNLKSK